jgi:tetratricopeptide (TPR) repeat protein
MPESLPTSVAMRLRDRRALLWACQARDLRSGEEPHGYSVAAAEVAVRYRLQPDPLDRHVASYYWEAVWLEGAASPLLPALKAAAGTEPDSRQIVLLAADDDAAAQLSSREFLPVCVLPGVLDPDAPAASRYGAVRGRVRERTAWALAERLRQYRERILIVLGAQENDDLERLSEVLEDCPIVDLEILLVWPPDSPEPDLPASPAIVVHVWRGTENDLLAAMAEAGAPHVADIPRYMVRIGNRALGLGIRDVDRILARFSLLTEQNIAPAATFTMENLLAFLDGSLEDWSAYSVGLPVERDYQTQGKPLHEDVLTLLREVQASPGPASTYIMRLPAEPGAGATTLLRRAAYAAAREGFPTLVLRPEQIAIDPEELSAFATTLSEGALALGLEQAPPLLIVIDVEHDQRGIAARGITSTLARQGRSVVVLHAVAAQESGEDVERRTRRAAVLPVLSATLEEGEIERCWRTLSQTVERWTLPVAVPSVYQWQQYHQATRWLGDDGRVTSLFWVALRFFLTEGMAPPEAKQAQRFLGGWITQRSEAIEDASVRDIVTYVAAMSSFRLPSPIWTVIRPAVGGTYPSDLSAAIRQLDGIVTWGGPVKGLDEDVIRFLHPALARAYLEHHADARSAPERMRQLGPVLGALSPGSSADIWVAESLAKDVLAPKFEERDPDWDWRLRTFELIPPAIRDQSKAILHHWARSLYQSAGQRTPRLEIDQRLERFTSAVEKLERATGLPRRPGRDEHPSHLYNTLGTAWYRYSLALQEADRAADAAAAWTSASAAFEKAIELSGGVNIEALLAFSRRLLDHAKAAGAEEQMAKASDVTQALELLDEADDVANNYSAPDPDWTTQVTRYRAEAFSQLSEELGEAYIDELINSADPELGYYCKAWLCLLSNEGAQGVDDALVILDEAEHAGVELRIRSVRLRVTLLERQPIQQRNFGFLKELYRRLDSEVSETVRPLDLFRYAVLCYQTGDYREGAESFRRLRAQSRTEDVPAIRMYDIWREPADPEQARLTQMRVDRWITEWRAQGYLLDLHQTVPFRPRHFSPPPERGQIVTCAIRFESNGPLAVPPRFVNPSTMGRRQAPQTTQ